MMKPKNKWRFVFFGLVLSIEQCYALGANSNHVINDPQWLANIFHDIKNCTPTESWYFDEKLGKSNNHLLEDAGYKAYAVDEYLAKYKVRQKFYGFDVVEISIPSGYTSIYTVTVNVSAQKLAKQIRSVTGKKIHIVDKKKKDGAINAEAYIVPNSDDQSMFVCFTFEE